MEGYRYFQSQFGPSEIDNLVGEVKRYINGSDSFVTEGNFDEDEPGENLYWEDSSLNHPSLRHFWDHHGNFRGDYDDGLVLFDSAANRGIQYFNSGRDLVGHLDGDWGDDRGAVPDVDIPEAYAAGDKRRAYYYLAWTRSPPVEGHDASQSCTR